MQFQVGLFQKGTGGLMNELEQTHPEYVYAILQGAGIVRWGRPIRGNFYCYKIPAGMGHALEHAIETHGPTSPETLELLRVWDTPWSHEVDDKGRETDGRKWKA